MIGYQSNRQKMLNAVLLNKRLMEYGGYEERDFASFDAALVSDNPIVRTVARIIQGRQDKNSPKNIYNEVADFLKKYV